MAYKPMFKNQWRETLWLREKIAAQLAGAGDHPICNLCGQPVTPDQAWDESHDGVPKAFGGKLTGVAHSKCNRDHGARVVVPMVNKADRVHRKFVGIDGPGLGKHPMRCGRRSGQTKTMTGGVQPRLTLAQKHQRFLAKRAIAPEVST